MFLIGCIVLSSFDQSIQSSYHILSNEESTRHFVSVTLHDHPILQPLLNLIKAIDNVLVRFQKESYYTYPKFHISVLSMTSLPDLAVNGVDEEVEHTSNTSVDRKEHVVPSNYATILSSSSSSSSSQYPTFATSSSTSAAAEAVDDSDNISDDEDVFIPLSQQKKLAMLPLTTAISITCIECRIGDRLFRLQLPKSLPSLPITVSGSGVVGGRGGEDKAKFTEIFD